MSPKVENTTEPFVEYDDVEDSSGTIFYFDVRPVRYVKIYSSINSVDAQVHISEVVP